MNVSEVVCGQDPMNIPQCIPCSDATFGSIRSAFGHQQLGKSCTWTAVAPFTQSAQVIFTDFATAGAGVGGCKALDDSKSGDLATLTSYFSTMGLIAPTAIGTCGGMSAQRPHVAVAPLLPPSSMPPPSMSENATSTPSSGKAGKGKKAKGKKAKAKGKAMAKGQSANQTQAAGQSANQTEAAGQSANQTEAAGQSANQTDGGGM